MFFRLSGLVTILALILSIVGATTQSNPIVNPVPATTKAGIILFVVSWVLLCILLVLVGSRYSSIEAGEHRLLWAILICVPLLLVRLIYSVIVDFAHNSKFNPITGNVTVQLVMAVLEEILITLIILGTGLTLDVRSKVVHEEVAMRPSQQYAPEQQGAFAGQTRMNNAPPPRRERRRVRRGGPVRMLVGLVADEVDRRRN